MERKAIRGGLYVDSNINNFFLFILFISSPNLIKFLGSIITLKILRELTRKIRKKE